MEYLHRDIIGVTVSYCMDIKSIKNNTSSLTRLHLQPDVIGMHIMENSRI